MKMGLQGSLGSPMWESGRMTEMVWTSSFWLSSCLIYSIHGDEEGDNLENLNDAKKQKKKGEKKKLLQKL